VSNSQQHQSSTDTTRREALYACILRYAPETGPLRERALDRLILVGLDGSTVAAPYKIGRIRENLRLGRDAPELRSSTIQGALARLIEHGKVGSVKVEQKDSYFLEAETANQLAIEAMNSQLLFERVITKHLHSTAHFIEPETGTKVMQQFLVECFVRFGRQIAKAVSGRLPPDDLNDRPDIGDAFAKATSNLVISDENRDSLYARCRALLVSQDPEDEALKFQLAQTFYILELLDIEGTYFNPLAEEAFNGAVFYLDTNTLLKYLLTSDEAALQFDEVVRLAKRVGVSLKVTRATINELRGVAADHINKIAEALDVIPNDILERSVTDDFLAGFLTQRQRESSLTPDQFFEQFDRISETLSAHAIELHDIVEEEIIAGREFKRAEEVIQRRAEDRGWGKSESTLKHDVAHFLLIEEERRTNRKTWFLTRDRSLVQAAIELANGQFPFCFSIAALLQSLSPFSTNAGEDHSLADAFSTIIAEQMLPTDRIFDIQEMSYLAKVHEDIFATPGEQVIQALDVVKTEIFKGKNLTTVDQGELSLELRKRLASTDQDLRRAAELERARAEELALRQAANAKSSEEQAIAAEKRAKELANENKSLLESRENTATRLSEIEQLLAASEVEKEQERKARLAESNMHARKRWFERTVILMGVSSCLIIFSESLSAFLAMRLSLQAHGWLLTLLVKYFGMIGMLGSPLSYLRLVQWPMELRIAIYTIIVVVCLFLLRPFSDSTLSYLSNYIQIGSALAMIIIGMLVLFRKRSN
jgi:DNA-binding Xre family transcriptional regulator